MGNMGDESIEWCREARISSVWERIDKKYRRRGRRKRRLGEESKVV